MQVVGVGIDIAEVARFEGLLRRGGQDFLARWFRAQEIIGLGPGSARAVDVALLFATKEAVLKAIRLPDIGPVPWRDIEIISPGSVRLHGAVAAHAATLGVADFQVAQARAGQVTVATVLARSGGHTP